MRARSNALLLIMFTVPLMPSAGLAGVGTLVTSMRETLLIETCVKRNARLAALPEALASCAPSAETAVMLGSKPRTATALGEASEYSMVTPGMNFMNSATLPSVTSPNASVATTFLMFCAKRCSLVARASPSVRREEEATNASSFTIPAEDAAAP